jgi:hypothetical protein
MPDAASATRKGFLASTPDASGTTVTDVGHVFGRLGEGNLNMPGVSLPFYWGDSNAANAPGIMISVFPNIDADAGLNTASSKIEIEGKTYAWANVDDFTAPL